MNRVIRLSLILLFSFSNHSIAQENKLPRDVNLLFSRSQEFWKLLGSNQRLKALEMVVPEKQELMVSSPQAPFTAAQITGIDFSKDPNRALVRVSMKVFVKDASAFMDFTVKDQWVWRKNNWFLDLNDGPLKEMFSKESNDLATKAASAAKIALEKNFSVSQSVIDLGKIPQGERRRFQIEIAYSGAEPAGLQVGFPTEAISNDGAPAQLTNATKQISLSLISELWEDDFSIPVTLKATLQGASVERTVIVRGSVLAPITIVQEPLLFVDAPGNDLIVKIRNHTDQSSQVVSISTAESFDIAEMPTTIAANGELVISLRRSTKASAPDKIYLTFNPAFNGRSIFIFPLRVRSER